MDNKPSCFNTISSRVDKDILVFKKFNGWSILYYLFDFYFFLLSSKLVYLYNLIFNTPSRPAYFSYRCAFFNYRFGSAAAQSVVLFLIVLVLTLVMFKIEKKGVKY